MFMKGNHVNYGTSQESEFLYQFNIELLDGEIITMGVLQMTYTSSLSANNKISPHVVTYGYMPESRLVRV